MHNTPRILALLALRRDRIGSGGAYVRAIDAASDMSVFLCRYQTLRLEFSQMIEQPLARHLHRFRQLRRRLRTIEQMKEPQPNRLERRSCTRGVVDDVESLGSHTDKLICLYGQNNLSAGICQLANRIP